MDKELRFISALLHAPRAEQAEFFNRQLPKGIFRQRLKELEWTQRFMEKYGQYPSPRAFKDHFGEQLFKPKDSLVATLQPVLDFSMFEQMRKVNEHVQEMIDSGEAMEKVVSYFKGASPKISVFDSSYKDISFANALGALKRYQHNKKHGDKVKLTTPWPSLNRLIKHVRRGETFVLSARTSMGKAQPLDAKVLTPYGFTKMGLLEVGEEIVDEKGNSQKVIALFPQGRKEVFRVSFNDGTSTECCDDHLWSVSSHDNKKRGDYSFSVLPLKEIRKRFTEPSGRLLWEVPTYQGTKNSTQQSLPLHPWLLGILLGDGCLVQDVTFTNPEEYIWKHVMDVLPKSDTLSLVKNDRITDCSTFRVRRKKLVQGRDGICCSTRFAIRKLGLEGKHSNDKFIPFEYLKAGFEDRLLLLQGLMDTDGHVLQSGHCFEHYTVSKKLAFQVLDLIRSLGGSAKQLLKYPKFTYKGELKEGQLCYITRFHFYTEVVPVSSPKHLNRIKMKKKVYRKMISKIESVGIKECQCISVSGPSKLYVTDDYIVTHNTWLFIWWSIHLMRAGYKVLFITKEMLTEVIEDRFESAYYNFSYELYRDGKLKFKDYCRWVRQRNEDPMPDNLIITGRDGLESGSDGFGPVISKIKEHSPDFVFGDGWYLIRPDDMPKNCGPTERFSMISNRSSAIARGMKIPLAFTIQVNREGEDEKEGFHLEAKST